MAKSKVYDNICELIKYLDSISAERVIDLAESNGLTIQTIETDDDATCALVSEGETYILCIPSNVRHLGNYIYDGDYTSGNRYGYRMTIKPDVLKNLKFTKHIQNILGDLIVIGGENVYNIDFMFAGCKFNSLDLRLFNTSTAKSMRGMFYGCNINTIKDLPHLDTSNVINMEYMFSNSVFNCILDISHFNTKKVHYMDYMFESCKASIYGISYLSYKRAYSLTGMFAHTQIQNFFYGKVDELPELGMVPRSMNGMFYNCAANWIDFTKGYINNNFHMVKMFAHSHIKLVTFTDAKFGVDVNMRCMFKDSVIDKIDFSGIEVDGYLNAEAMFLSCSAILINWVNIRNIYFENTRVMFANAKVDSHLDLSKFETSKVKDMSGMFLDCTAKSIDVSELKTQNVESMDGMFCGCKAYSLDLSNFNIDNVRGDKLKRMFWNFMGEIETDNPRIREVYRSKGLGSFYELDLDVF